jgi:hypothetical protein
MLQLWFRSGDCTGRLDVGKFITFDKCSEEKSMIPNETAYNSDFKSKFHLYKNYHNFGKSKYLLSNKLSWESAMELKQLF